METVEEKKEYILMTITHCLTTHGWKTLAPRYLWLLKHLIWHGQQKAKSNTKTKTMQIQIRHYYWKSNAIHWTLTGSRAVAGEEDATLFSKWKAEIKILSIQ